MSGWLVVDNTFVRCQAGVRLGGGRDVVIRNNTFINVTVGVHFDNRGMHWQQRSCNVSADPNATLVLDLHEVLSYEPPLWAERFPKVASIEADHICVPVHNEIVDNTYCGATVFVDDGRGNALNATRVAEQWFSTIAHNRLVRSNC